MFTLLMTLTVAGNYQRFCVYSMLEQGTPAARVVGLIPCRAHGTCLSAIRGADAVNWC